MQIIKYSCSKFIAFSLLKITPLSLFTDLMALSSLKRSGVDPKNEEPSLGLIHIGSVKPAFT